MSDKKSMNPLGLLVGLVAGAAGALVLSEKNPGLTKKVVKRVKQTLSDWRALGEQAQLDQPKKKTVKPKK